MNVALTCDEVTPNNTDYMRKRVTQQDKLDIMKMFPHEDFHTWSHHDIHDFVLSLRACNQLI
jgi:cephalosporin-C deacetylase-like acetyl esterase